MDIPHEKRFHFGDGSSAGSLGELQSKLEGISYQDFYRHVNADKNDFANWVRHVLDEEQLAEDLQKVSSIVETVEILNDFLHPLPAERSHDDMQSRIEEEVLDIHVPTGEPTTAHEPETEEVIITEAIKGGLADPGMQPDEPAKSERVLSQHDYTRLIVKDFIYGLFFGLIIGLVLGRIISF